MPDTRYLLDQHGPFKEPSTALLQAVFQILLDETPYKPVRVIESLIPNEFGDTKQVLLYHSDPDRPTHLYVMQWLSHRTLLIATPQQLANYLSAIAGQLVLDMEGMIETYWKEPASAQSDI